jgi:hypothetical protein
VTSAVREAAVDAEGGDDASRLATAASLLRRACALYDAQPALGRDARAVATRAFGGGLAWMEARVAGGVRPGASVRGHVAGTVKYALCVVVGLGCAAVGTMAPVPLAIRSLLAGVTFVLAFYALESRWVFVFPAMAHGVRGPFGESWRRTAEHGGTLASMRVVMPLAAWMLTGWARGEGALRAWATGCLAVLLWYRDLVGLGPLDEERAA